VNSGIEGLWRSFFGMNEERVSLIRKLRASLIAQQRKLKQIGRDDQSVLNSDEVHEFTKQIGLQCGKIRETNSRLRTMLNEASAGIVAVNKGEVSTDISNVKPLSN
jgi:hypothetical protein